MLSPTRLLEPLREFLRQEAAGGIVLMAAAAVALVIANSPWWAAWDDLWHTQLGVIVGDRSWSMSLVHWINDGLMAIFFLVVGLEIKRELRMGELREPRKALLPIVAAVGGDGRPGAHLPRAERGGSGSHSGWGVPMATDIAFAVGVLAMRGTGGPRAAQALPDDAGHRRRPRGRGRHRAVLHPRHRPPRRRRGGRVPDAARDRQPAGRPLGAGLRRPGCRPVGRRAGVGQSTPLSRGSCWRSPSPRWWVRCPPMASPRARPWWPWSMLSTPGRRSSSCPSSPWRIRACD